MTIENLAKIVAQLDEQINATDDPEAWACLRHDLDEVANGLRIVSCYASLAPFQYISLAQILKEINMSMPVRCGLGRGRYIFEIRAAMSELYHKYGEKDENIMEYARKRILAGKVSTRIAGMYEAHSAKFEAGRQAEAEALRTAIC